MHTSEDGQWMWNGTKWVPNTTSSPVSITLQSTISPEHSMHSYLPSSLDQKNGLLRIVPFIGTILLMISFFLPYLNIIGYTISAFDLVFLAFEFLDFGEFFGGGFSELAKACDRGEVTRQDAAACVLYASEAGMEVAHQAVQALGGAGFLSDSPVSRIFRDAKLMEIGAGTSEIRRMLIGRELMEIMR